LPKTPPSGGPLKRPMPGGGGPAAAPSPAAGEKPPPSALPPPPIMPTLPPPPSVHVAGAGQELFDDSVPPPLGSNTSHPSLSITTEKSTEKSPEDDALAAEIAQWKVYAREDGRKYYHHEPTGTTTWEKPECLKKRVKKHRKNPSATSRDELTVSQPATKSA